VSSTTALRPTSETTADGHRSAAPPRAAKAEDAPATGVEAVAPAVDAEVIDLATRRRAQPEGLRRAGTSDRDLRRPRPTPGRTTSETRAARMAAMLVVAHGEVAAGLRPFDQLRPWLAPTLVRRLAVRLRTTGPDPTAKAVVTNVLTAPPTPSGAIEATVIVRRGPRGGAVAVRLERHRGRWRATELTAPESGHAPLLTRPGTDDRDAFDEVADEAALLRAPRGSA
jgi:hypothetical protein